MLTSLSVLIITRCKAPTAWPCGLVMLDAVGQAGSDITAATPAPSMPCCLKRPSSRFEDALSGGLLVVLAVAHERPLSPCSRSVVGSVFASHYCIMAVI
jgi:hypothetical protein